MRVTQLISKKESVLDGTFYYKLITYRRLKSLAYYWKL